jgi:hypothetical protein
MLEIPQNRWAGQALCLSHVADNICPESMCSSNMYAHGTPWWDVVRTYWERRGYPSKA